ncbi:hypothetical protein Daus18300_001396 [Diaporthe australafricana]|uniref:DUF6594 domain-containing protein n=1 Tax=Diaporthe australafricana TaxID=127596 RepID=A0ABR3XWR1_9PEZI
MPLIPEVRGRPAGYAQWASWLASDPDGETLVFRKFNKLAAINLLCLQSELLEVERRLSELNEASLKSKDMDLLSATRKYEALLHQCEPPDAREDARERMDLIKDLRLKMKEYQEALLLQSRIAELHSPDSRVLSALRQEFEADGISKLEGEAKRYLSQSEDLVALKNPTHDDSLTRYLKMHWASQSGPPSSPDYGGGRPSWRRFDESKITRTVNIATTFIAALFLIGPILALYFVSIVAVKLVLLGLFTAGFAGSTALITNARRAEIFAGTAT